MCVEEQLNHRRRKRLNADSQHERAGSPLGRMGNRVLHWLLAARHPGADEIVGRGGLDPVPTSRSRKRLRRLVEVPAIRNHLPPARGTRPESNHREHPKTRQRDHAGWTSIYPKHVHRALRRFVGVKMTEASQRFPFHNTEDLPLFD